MLNLPGFAPLFKVSVVSWIGNAAAVLLGGRGAVTEQAEKAGCSRQAAYEHADKVRRAVEEARLPGPPRADLLEENRRLRQENQQLRDRLAAAAQQAADSIPFDQGKRLRLATLGWAMGLSLYQIEDLFCVLLGDAGNAPDHATLGRWLLAQARQATKLLEVLDRHTTPQVRYLCLDEIFFRRRPVLMAVEPRSMAWLLGQRAPDRTGQTWLKALEPFGQLEFAQSDQGSGLQKGLRLLAEQRRQEAARAQAEPGGAGKPKPLLSNGLDLFHISQEAGVPLRARWRGVEEAFRAYEAAEVALAEAKQRRPKAVGGLSRRLQAAWEHLEWYWSWYDSQERAWQRARGAFELFRPDGQLNDRAWAEGEIKAACSVLKGPAWKKVRRLLQDARSLAFLDRLHQQLARAEPRPEVREALVRLWRLQSRPATAAFPAAVVLARALCGRLAEDWESAYGRVSEALSQVLRASSAVECLNSIVRMQQARHRNLSQEMLDLKRLYWNCRPFRQGKRAGRCPYQLLGVPLPTFDCWDLLQLGPDILGQQLSTQRVAA
jgi:hypothetical protein